MGSDGFRPLRVYRKFDHHRFHQSMGTCDIFLDSIGWSGFNSTSESLVNNLPVVTLRGGIRGRHSTAILNRIGVQRNGD